MRGRLASALPAALLAVAAAVCVGPSAWAEAAVAPAPPALPSSGTSAQPGSGGAGKVTLAPALEPRQGRIGDRFVLTVSAGGPETGAAQESDTIEAGAKIGAFRILETDLSQPGKLALTITPEEAGDLELPAFQVIFRSGSGQELEVDVPASRASVESVLKEGDSALADLRPPAELPVPWPWRTIILWTLAAAGIAAAAWYVRRLWKRPRPAPGLPEEVLPPGMTADVWVRLEFERLMSKRLIEGGMFREFHIQLSDVMRRYLELRFRIPAMERTTEEIGDEMRRALLPEETARITRDLLVRCDRVKFAKHAPDSIEIEGTIAIATRIVEITAPAPPVPAAGIVQAAESPA